QNRAHSSADRALASGARCPGSSPGGRTNFSLNVCCRKRSHDGRRFLGAWRQGMDGTPVGLVTGAGSGIGRASALAMAETGVFVICADRDEEAARTVAEALKAAGGDAWAVGVDVGCEEQVESMY